MNIIKGFFAISIALSWVMVRMFSIMLPLAILIMVPALVAKYFWGDAGFAFALGIAGLMALPIWIVPAFTFFFPAYFDLIRLSGLFLQRAGRLQPADTLQVVKARWDRLHANGRRWWRFWLARN